MSEMTPGQAAREKWVELSHWSVMPWHLASQATRDQWDQVAQAAIAASGRDKLVEALKEIIDLGPPFGAQTIVARAALAEAEPKDNLQRPSEGKSQSKQPERASGGTEQRGELEDLSGKGQKTSSQFPETEPKKEKCPACQGRRYAAGNLALVLEKPCPTCHGTGLKQ